MNQISITGLPDIDARIIRGMQIIARRGVATKSRDENGRWVYDIDMQGLTDIEAMCVDFVANGDRVFGHLETDLDKTSAV